MDALGIALAVGSLLGEPPDPLPWPLTDAWTLTDRFLSIAASDPLSFVLIAVGGALTAGTVAVGGYLAAGAAVDLLVPDLGASPPEGGATPGRSPSERD